jgi:hypothetical protein
MIFRQKSSKIDHFSFGPDSLSFTVTQIQLLPVWGFSSFFLVFVIFRPLKSSKIDHFSFGPDSLSFTVTQIQLLPVWDNFYDFSSKIIKNRLFWFWSGFSIVYRYPDTATSGLG